jgi:phosphoserine phosphatase RsbX
MGGVPLPSEIASIEWGVAARPMPGQSVSGDIHSVVPIASGAAVAVADGLGHGDAAALAATIAAETFTTYAEQPLTDIVMRCHEALRHTRGVVLSLAAFDAMTETMTWIGVGNVEGALFRASPEAQPRREVLLQRGGVVGYSLPRPRMATLPLFRGDTLIFATDGIHSRFKLEPVAGGCSQSLATDLLLRYGRDTDDALVLVVRYIGML